MKEKNIPIKFKVLESIAYILAFSPIVFMFLDFFYGLTTLSSMFYFFASACGVSLLITTKIAKKEWIARNSTKRGCD